MWLLRKSKQIPVAVQAPPLAAGPAQNAVTQKEIELIQAGKIRSVLAAGMTLKGDILLDGEGARVDGRVQGSVEIHGTAVLVIGPTAVIEGNVKAPHIILAGTVQGDIVVKRIQITRTANVYGVIRYHQQQIQNGANLSGGMMYLRADDVQAQFPAPSSYGQTLIDAAVQA